VPHVPAGPLFFLSQFSFLSTHPAFKLIRLKRRFLLPPPFVAICFLMPTMFPVVNSSRSNFIAITPFLRLIHSCGFFPFPPLVYERISCPDCLSLPPHPSLRPPFHLFSSAKQPPIPFLRVSTCTPSVTLFHHPSSFLLALAGLILKNSDQQTYLSFPPSGASQNSLWPAHFPPFGVS